MMRLTLKDAYKSITMDDKQNLESVELPDFCIITGKNGSGKTHLLEAIAAGAISIESNNFSDYGPSMYVDYHTVSFNGSISYSNGSSPFFKKANDIQIEINKSFELNSSVAFSVIADKVSLATRIVDKMLQSTDKITSIEQVRNLGYSELSVIDPILKDRGYPNRVDRICKNLLVIYTKHKEFLLSIKTKFPRMNIETVMCNFYGQSKGFKESLHNSYKNYLTMRKDMCIEAMAKGRLPSEDDIEARCGECPLYFLNRIFKICNYAFNTNHIDDDFTTIMKMNDKEISEYKPSLTLRRDNLELDLDALSSGERVMLSLSLLILENTIFNGEKYKILLLDEVETNLHPSMLQSFLDLIQKSFIKELGLKIFLVTHSPSTIAFAPKDSVFVMRGKEEEGKRIEQTNNEKALNTLTEGFATLDKGLHLLDQIARQKISIITEGHNTKYIQKALSFYYQDKDVGVLTGIEDKTGDSQLSSLYELFIRVKHDNKVIIVFDCDATKIASGLKDNNNNTYIFMFDKNEENKKVKKGVENLFSEHLTDIFHSLRSDTDKNNFRNYMLEHGTKEHFKNFLPLIDKINEIKNQ